MNNVILDAVDELIAEIRETKNYTRLLKLKKDIDNDAYVTKLIIEFNQAKVKYDEVVKYGKHHPDLQQVKLELANAKTILFNHDLVKEYKKLEKDIQKMLDEISKKIAQSVSPRIKYPNEIGLINKH